MIDLLYGWLEAAGYLHPVHPVSTHLPIGMVFGAFLFGVASLIRRSDDLGRAARYCALAALVFAIPTGLLGIADWQHFYAGGWLVPVKIKLALAGLLAVLLVAAVISGWHSQQTSGCVLALYMLSLLTVMGLGYFGGNLVYEGRTPPGGPLFAAGERIFRGNCSGCHPYGGNSVASAFPVRGAPQLKDAAAFAGWLRDPRVAGRQGIMPPFSKERISDDQVALLYNYVLKVMDARPHAQLKADASKPAGVKTAAASSKRGQALFASHCTECHRVNGSGGDEGPGLKGVLKRAALPSGRPATAANIYRQLRDPYKEMPSFKDKLTDEEVSDIIAYLATR